MARPLSAEVLLDHAGFVRALARGLLAGGPDAEDLAQETLLAALDRPPPRRENVRSWLRTVARNLALRRRRGERRRARHEARAWAEAERRRWAEAADERAARVEMQRRVIDAVLALPDAYRDAIVARYLDELRPEEIAARLGIPVETVRTRLRRGLAMVRARLDARRGGRQAWALALAPLLARRALAGGILVGTKAKAALLAALLLLALLGVQLGRQATVEGPAGRAPRPEPRDAAAAAGDAGPATVAEPGAAGDAPAVAAEEWDYRLTGNVPGARVALRFRYYGGAPDPEPIVKAADASGFTGFDLPERAEPLFDAHADVDAEGHLPLRLLLEERATTYALEAATLLRGHVIDPEGRPVPEAFVNNEAVTDEEGRFLVRAVRRIAVKRHGFLPLSVEVDYDAAREVTLRLERGLSVSGRVTLPDGTPLEAWLKGGSDWTETGPDGRYTLSGFEQGEEVQVACSTTVAGRRSGGGAWLVLTVAAGTENVDFRIYMSAVRVTVVDDARRPFRHARVTASFRAPGFSGNTEYGTTGMGGAFTCLAKHAEACVTATAPGHEVVEETRTLRGGWLHEFRLVLAPLRASGTLAISASSETGPPLPFVFASLCTAGGAAIEEIQNLRVELDEGGRATLEVAPGRYRATLSGTHTFRSIRGYGMPVTREVTVRPRESVPLDVRIPEGGRIRVTVRDAGGNLLPAGRLELLREDGGNTWTYFCPEVEGDYIVMEHTTPEPVLTAVPVAPGRYRVRQTDGDRSVEAAVVVERGRTTDVEIRR